MAKKKDYFKRGQNFYQKDFEGMTDKKFAIYIRKQFKDLNIKPPKYLNKYNTIAENKQRALKRIEKQIMKKALESAKKSSFFNKKQEKLYNNYKSLIDENKQMIVNELKDMGANQTMIDSFLMGRELLFKGDKIFINQTAITDRDILSLSTGMIKSGKNKEDYLKELNKNAKLKTKAEYGENMFQLAQKIANINGFTLNDNDKKALMEELKNVNYFGRHYLTRRIVSKLNNAYYELYKEELDLTTPDKLIDELRSDIFLYNKEAIKNGLSVRI